MSVGHSTKPVGSFALLVGTQTKFVGSFAKFVGALAKLVGVPTTLVISRAADVLSHHSMESHVIAVSVGLPREVVWRGRTVRTSIFKEPVDGRVRVERLNLAGDRQSDLTVHGGAEKAVYVYPSEHYEYWRQKLGIADLPWGSFGENLTTEGLDEATVQIGDRLTIGTASFMVTQPRMPCYKLALRFDRLEMVKWFLESGRTGFYLSVLHEGELEAGDTIRLERERASTVAVADIISLYARDAENQELLRRATEVAALPEAWREYFRERLWEPDSTEK